MSRQFLIKFLRCEMVSFWNLRKKNNFSSEFHPSSAMLLKQLALTQLRNKYNIVDSQLCFQNRYISLGENRSLKDPPSLPCKD